MLAARIFAHPLPAALGTYSFQVYLLHWPPTRYLDDVGGALPYVILVGLSAALYTELIEVPLVKYARRLLR